MPRDRFIKNWSPLEEAEAALFPNRPYEQLTNAQREATIAYAKRLVEERIGWRMIDRTEWEQSRPLPKVR